MNLIIGGAYQEKLEYAKNRYGVNDSDVFVCTNDTKIDKTKKVLYHFEEYLMYCMKNDETPDLDFSDDTIIIMNDIFCGVVSVDPQIRAWREFCGRTGTEISKKSEHVTRMFCGIPQELK